MPWHAWRFDGTRWHRCPNPRRADGTFADLGAASRHLSRVEDELGIPTTWTGMTKGEYPQWTPAARRLGETVERIEVEDA